MKKQSWFRRNIDLIQTVIALAIVVVAFWDMLGKPARPALLLTLVCASIALGATIVVYVKNRQANRQRGEEH